MTSSSVDRGGYKSFTSRQCATLKTATKRSIRLCRSNLRNLKTQRALVCKLHGRPQAWARDGELAPPLEILEMLKSVFAAMLSKTSVNEVFMHHFEKMSSASGGYAPQTATGELPLDPAWGLPSFRPPHCLQAPHGKLR